MIRLTSPQDPKYNCVAWALRDKDNFIWPAKDYAWPEDPPISPAIDIFIQFFRNHGYVCCDNCSLEDGFEKIVIFGKSDDEPSHVARQLASGLWTSKLGTLADIEHNLIEDLVNDFVLASFGPVRIVMRRKIDNRN